MEFDYDLGLLDPSLQQGLNESETTNKSTNWILIMPPLVDKSLNDALKHTSLAIGIFGLLFNFSFIFVWARVSSIRTVTNYFLLNLCFADVIYLSFMTTYRLIFEYIRKPYQPVRNPEALCGSLHFFILLSQNASVFTIALVSTERYIAICHPIKAKRLTRKAILLRTIIGIWIVSAIFSVPTVLMCVDGLLLKMAIPSLVVQISPFGISLCVVCVLYALIIKQMHSRKAFVSSTGGENVGKHFRSKFGKDKRQVILVLVVTTVVFFVCVFPYHFKTILEIVGVTSKSREMPISLQSYYVLTPVSWMLLFVNSAVNPIIYKIFSSKHRQAFCEALGRRRNYRHPSAQRIMSRSSTTSTELNQTMTNGGNVKMISYSLNEPA
ncbi:somatostatin receptor type 5-like [Glandiceps talaboti]